MGLRSIHLIFLLGLSPRETAVRLGLTEGNVKTIQYRALKRAAALAGMIRGVVG